MKNLLFINLTVLLLLSACEGESYTPFDEVVAYYAERLERNTTHDDSLKYEAARFLQRYSKHQYGVSRHLVDSVGERVSIDYKMFADDKELRKYIEINGYYFKVWPKVKDVDTIKAEFLINNIEQAFDSWKKPWAADISFSDFCTYILPYRVWDEELSDWRSKFKEKYEESIEDSVEVLNIRNVALYLVQQLKKELIYGTSFGALYRGLLTPEEMEMLHSLECKALAHYGTLALRACGIPCAMLETNWRFTEVGHRSIFVPATGNNEHAFRLSIYDDLQEMGMPKDSMATWRSWIYTYEANPDLLNLCESKDTEVKQFAEPVTRMDITSVFSSTHNFSLLIPKEYRDKRYFFLCRFHNWEWYPIREGRIDGDSVRFKDATIRQLYRLGYMDDKMLYTFGKMFTITGNHELLNYDCTGDTVTFHLNVECKPEEWMTEKEITVYLGGDSGEWEPYTAQSVLWSINEETVEYRLFDESLRGIFKPIFHQIRIRLPKHSVFTHNQYPRPIGFLFEDTIANEGHFMSF